ncbi:MAG: hypothetical protein M3R01_02360 [Actinomycetota bacterium]|nr:hypothetical protein [Actinomycetota bacterium]
MRAAARPWLAGVFLLVTAGVYAWAESAGLTFSATPLAVGLGALSAGVASGSARLVPVGLALVGWGSAVLAVDEAMVERGRIAPSYVLGAVLGLLAAESVARGSDRRLTGALVTLLVAALAALAARDLAVVGDWPGWALAMAGWGLYELAVAARSSATRAASSRPPGRGRRRSA